MLRPISTNEARKLIEDALGVPKVNLEAVKKYFTCVSENDAKGIPKFWEQKREIAAGKRTGISRLFKFFGFYIFLNIIQKININFKIVLQNFKLINKKNLTHNIYELVFESDNNFSFKAGQFITFLIPIGGRAYSILEETGKELKLIIKKRELEEGGRGGSKYLCELEIGEIIRGVGPAGHFTLKENEKNKLFLGTGTGFVPLYNQIIYGLKNNLNCNFKLIFGARTNDDLFYINELNNLKKEYNNFDFEVYLSREEIVPYKKGYITDFLDYDTKNKFSEVYICGTPNMIDSSIDILIEKGFEKENIFTEKY